MEGRPQEEGVEEALDEIIVLHGSSQTKTANEMREESFVLITYQNLISERTGSNMNFYGGAMIGCFGVHNNRLTMSLR